MQTRKDTRVRIGFDFVILSTAKNPVWQRWSREILRFAQDEYEIDSMQDNEEGFA